MSSRVCSLGGPMVGSGACRTHLVIIFLTLCCAGEGTLRAGTALAGPLPGRLVVLLLEGQVPERTPQPRVIWRQLHACHRHMHQSLQHTRVSIPVPLFLSSHSNTPDAAWPSQAQPVARGWHRPNFVQLSCAAHSNIRNVRLQTLGMGESPVTQRETWGGAHLQPAPDELLGLHVLFEQAVAQDEGVPQLQLLEEAHGGPHQPCCYQLLAQLLAQRRAHGEAYAECMPVRPPARSTAGPEQMQLNCCAGSLGLSWCAPLRTSGQAALGRCSSVNSTQCTLFTMALYDDSSIEKDWH